ncbi:hypothetical protein KEM52_005768 [Ascosphaera acerosa]|nr:hypothetical protein KEM52_005768 [Ascosphaera acerosa]
MRDFLPNKAHLPASNPAYPSPNLYDLVLALSADPGLDAWWSKVASILHAHYGAERASLTVPGDYTDLQNVPWGQKATYTAREQRPPGGEEQLGSGEATPTPDAMPAHTPDGNGLAMAHEARRPSTSPGTTSAAMVPAASLNEQLRLLPVSDKAALSVSEDEHSDVPTDATISPTTIRQPRGGPISSRQRRHNGARAVVFPNPRELEKEESPLIKRVGVVKLLGRTSPIVLTREYCNDPARQGSIASDSSVLTAHASTAATATVVDVGQATPVKESASRPAGGSDSVSSAIPAEDPLAKRPPLTRRQSPTKLGDILSSDPYEDYEQPVPSPWSQSPAPSPAPLADEEENPFFVDPHKVDERAFASDPPPTHDYSVDTVPAIGTDTCKTIIHIPLLHTSTPKQTPDPTIRFPVAIISLLTSVVPYPQNLRQSLAFLLPHLTTSYCLADQYSKLEKQLAASSQQRLGQILGLGGTFSDASSELELVAELSGQAHAMDGGAENSKVGVRTAAHDSSVRSDLAMAVNASRKPMTRMASAPARSIYDESVLLESGMRARLAESFKLQLSPHLLQSASSPRSLASNGLSQAELVEEYFQFRKNSLNHASQPWLRPRSSSTGQYDELVNGGVILGLDGVSNNVRLSLPTPVQRHQSSTSVTTSPRDIYTRPFPDTVAQLILNSIPLHLFLAKPNSGEVIWTNAKFDAYRGGQQEQRLRDPFMSVHEEDRPIIERKWASVLRQGPEGTVPCRVRSCQSHAEYRHFIFRANPLLSSTGEALYWIGSFLDVHEQRLREMEALSEREKLQADAKYRAFTNSIPQIVFEAGEHRGLISVNDQWQLYTGQPTDDALNLGFTKFIHPDDLEKCVGLSSQTLSGHHSHLHRPLDEHRKTEMDQANSNQEGQSLRDDTAALDFNSEIPRRHGPHRSASGTRDEEDHPLFPQGITSLLQDVMNTGIVKMKRDENGRDFYITEIRLKSRLGEYRWHLVRLVKVDSFGDGEASWYGTCTDINDHKILEQSFNTAMEKLNIEMESKTKFFSNMSHEIRTPLNGILGTIPFLLDTQLDNEQRRMLDTIHNSSMNLRELVDNILDVSKVEAGKMNLVQQWFHLRSVLEDVMDTIGSRAIDRGLELNYLVDPNVPSMIIGDRFRIRQILINLVGNAVKFTAQGEIYTHCSVYEGPDAKVDGNQELYINFDVVDTGRGFTEEESKILMQRFSQAQNSNGSQQGGTGLGLFLSKQLVEMHGGKLTPWSEGRGAKFSFFVKVRAPPPMSPEGIAQQLATDVPSGRDQRLETMGHGRYAPTHLSTGPLSPQADAMRRSGITVDTILVSAKTDEQTDSLPSAASTPTTSTDPSRGQLPSAGRSDSQAGDATTETASDQAEPKKTPSRYDILIVCPLQFARKAVKEHIEQVIPYDVPSKVTAVPEVDDWKDLAEADKKSLTHLVLSLQDTNDILDVVHCMCALASSQRVNPNPSLVIISDLYKRREIMPSLKRLQTLGKQVFVIPKPVKPSSFSPIFDPENKRDLSKDRNQDMVRAVNNNFRTMSRIVKEVIGNKGYRILLVEDDSTNLGIMLRYLDKVRLASETASNGQECLDMVFSKEPGYYSLIICDIQMPVKDGYDTCREIRAWESFHHFPQIPIMALSANAMHDQIDGAARAGFNDYLTKPIKHNEFGKRMMDLLVGSENGPAPFYLKAKSN